VRNTADVDAVLSDSPSPDREAMRIKEYAKFAFLTCYGALFAMLGALLGSGTIQGCGVASALFGVAENFLILRIIDTSLAHTTAPMLIAIRVVSLIKWWLASIALGALALKTLSARQIGLRLAGALCGIAAFLGLCGLYEHWLLQGVGPTVLCGLIDLAAVYFRPYWRVGRRSA
jgi:hypothetical protein